MTEFRKKIRVEGNPLDWTTNLCDEDIAELYKILEVDPDFQESRLEVKGMAISFQPFQKNVPFREGWCLCIGCRTFLTAVYRSEPDWVLWDARQREIQELKEEKADQYHTKKVLFEVADTLLVEKGQELISQKDYAAAAAVFSERVERAKTIEKESEALGYKIYQVWHMRDSSLQSLSRFPTTDYAIEFLRKHLNFWWSYLRTAEGYFFIHCRNEISKIEEINKVFLAATIEFPQEGKLYKRICLFLERHNQIHMALLYCREACDRGLKDDTQKGFPFRLKRLLRKATGP